MNDKPTNRKPLPSRTRLFLFTRDDERQIFLAKVLAFRFMKKYGKGRQPQLINKENYL